MIGILKRFWRNELGGFTPGFLFFFLAVIVVFGSAMNVKGTRIQKKRIEGVAQAIALELVRGINNPHITREEAVERAFQTGWVASGANLDVGVAAMRSAAPAPFVLEDITTIKYGRYEHETLRFMKINQWPMQYWSRLSFPKQLANRCNIVFSARGMSITI